MSLPTTYITDREPAELFAGVSAAWTKSLADFPATTWQLSYTLTPPSGSVIAVAWSTHVTASGSDFAISIPGSLTTGVTAGGSGRLTGKVTSGSDTAIVYDATLNWKVIGERSLAQRMLTLIDAMLLGNASREEQTVQVSFPGGTSKMLGLCSKEELLRTRNYWAEMRNNEVEGERADQGLGSRRIIRRRYLPPR